MRTIAVLFLLAMAAIYAAVHAVQPKALQKETPAQASTVDLSRSPSTVGSGSVIAAPHVAHDAKAETAR